MKRCEMKLATGQQCPNEMFANIGVLSNNGPITVNVCLEHLDQIASRNPTSETPFAARQREQQERGW